MAPSPLRKLVGTIVTLHTTTGDLRGKILSCTIESVWILDETEDDVIVPLSNVRSFDRMAA